MVGLLPRSVLDNHPFPSDGAIFRVDNAQIYKPKTVKSWYKEPSSDQTIDQTIGS